MGLIRSAKYQAGIKTKKITPFPRLPLQNKCKKCAGKPDIVLKKYRLVIFVNGCFWHGHNKCKIFRMPKSNLKYWNKKIKSNKQRDRRNKIALTKLGWHHITIWECQLKKDINKCLKLIKLNM